VIVVDANVLLYAHDASSSRHAVASEWLGRAVGGSETVGLGLVTVLAFLRISTDPRIFERPLVAADAIAIVEEWLASPNVTLLAPSDRHWRTLAEQVDRGQAKGPLLMDAHLATLVLEHGATLATTDRDFSRFPGLRTIDPTAA
jgi:toxin-antitoxin system PIN domain toxin